jgi:demethylmenaquinone methyltransferase/2-methoxy-6-polyprenyl-1,4-benzoquinol methylase
MFDRISPRYDLLNTILSLGLDRLWRRRAVEAARPREGGRYLDAGCGTGDMVLELLRQSPGSSVVGIDLSPKMLELAAAKVRKAGLSGRGELRIGDVTAMDFAAASFDGVLSAFCIRNVVDRLCALRELRRVLLPGGWAVVLELTRPSGGALRLAHRLYNRWVVPLVARPFADARAYRYLGESIEAFPDAREVVSLMRQAGFLRPVARPLSGGIVTLFVGQNWGHHPISAAETG